MLVQDLIKTINIFNVNVEYDSSEHCKKRILNGDSAVYFAVANDEEQRKYQIKNCTDMKSTTATIHVPNLSVRELVNIYECDGTGLFDLTNEMISKFYNESISNDIIFSIFLFLHEVGHWMQFEKIDRNIYEYMNI